VVGRNDDGYHQLSSLVAFCDVADRLSVKFIEPLSQDRYEIEGPFGFPLSQEPMESNLIAKAVHLIREKTKLMFKVDVKLSKNLPLASGIGGGSADAAGTLRLLNIMLGDPLSQNELAEMALALGADVPMCLDAQAKWVEGIGEIIAPCENLPGFPILLVNPLILLPTQKVFNHYKQSRVSFDMPLKRVDFNRPDHWISWLKSVHNALYFSAAHICPVVVEIIHALEQTSGNLLGRLSGSGATCFGLYDSIEASQHAEGKLRDTFPEFWIARGMLNLTTRHLGS
jgi:4-diphosphocytidyl-2-C-methyl-D-erythritol kinase